MPKYNDFDLDLQNNQPEEEIIINENYSTSGCSYLCTVRC